MRTQLIYFVDWKQLKRGPKASDACTCWHGQENKNIAVKEKANINIIEETSKRTEKGDAKITKVSECSSGSSN